MRKKIADELAIRWLVHPRPASCSTKDIFALQDANIVVYFAHGLGDFVMFGNIVQFLARTKNKLHITRVGDHYVGIYDRCDLLRPVYSGITASHTHDGAEFGKPDFNLAHPTDLRVTSELQKNLEDIKCTHICVENFFEHYGSRHRPPFHSKSRNLIYHFRDKLTPQELASLDQPLPNVINTSPHPLIDDMVERRLRAVTPYNKDTRIVVISRYGATSCEKNWGHKYRCREFPKEGDEARQFIKLCRDKNKNTLFVTMEDSSVTGINSLVDHAHNVFRFGEVFSPGSAGVLIPYAMLLMALFRKTDVHVGCPTGPAGVATLFDNLQNVILWIDMFPSWFFEPTANTINILGDTNIATRKSRAGSFAEYGKLAYNNVYTAEPHISPNVIFPLIEHRL